MTEAAGTFNPASPRPIRLWLRRLGESNAFAMTVSIGLHATVFWVLYFAVFRTPSPPEHHIVPEARLVAAGGAVAPPKLTPLRLAQQAVPRRVSQPVLRPEELPLAAVTLDALPRPVQPETNPTSVSASLTAPAMGLPAGRGPLISLFGQAGNARKVVYVVDVSASLMVCLDRIVAELRRSVASLKATQQFHVVLAGPGRVIEFPRQRLVPAIEAYTRATMKSLDAISRIPTPGKADPIEAMRRAFSVRPELIYFLTDGDYRNIEAELEDTLLQLNPDRVVSITTIGFDPSPDPAALLKRIADRHQGNFRVVSECR